MFAPLRSWWQVQTGEEDTPFDRDSSSFIASLVVHLVLILVLGLMPVTLPQREVSLTILMPDVEELEELVMPDEFHFRDDALPEIGAHSDDLSDLARSTAPVVADIPEIPTFEFEITETEVPDFDVNRTVIQAVALHQDNLPVKGAPMGQHVTGTSGAIDRLTHEILLSLEERKTLVVWLFDQSFSLMMQRQEIHDRFDRIYEELGIIEASGNQAFTRHDDRPLLSSVVAFGNTVTLMTREPTDNLAEIKEAVASIPNDDTGIERTFSAIYMAANEYRRLRIPRPPRNEPQRNVLLIVFTDEAGDDQEGLEETIQICRRYAMPVYVVGSPAPFGRQETLMKWVDPNPNYDQTPRWGRVDQGPESLMPERIRLEFPGWDEDTAPLDSGFGPYALTRLCYETGGIFFSVHPNRNMNRSVSRGETAPYTAHLRHFFDPDVMRRYRPDYVPQEEYLRRVRENRARYALIQAARMSWVTPMESPRLRFVRRSEAELVNALTEAQRDAAILEPKLNMLYETLRQGEADREREETPRWQAGYDLAYGRVLAVKVRTEGYNAMLAAAKRGLNFSDEKNNTWVLKPADEINVGSRLEREAEKARALLQRVVDDHPGTPWALLAQRELDNPIGWKWEEDFTELEPRRQGGGGNANAPPPRDDERRVLDRPPPSRPVPKL